MGVGFTSGPGGRRSGVQQWLHGLYNSGLAGSPKIGDKDAWANRIAQGMDSACMSMPLWDSGQGRLHAAQRRFAHLVTVMSNSPWIYMVEQSQ